MMSEGIRIFEESGRRFFEVPKDARTDYATHKYFRYIGRFPPQIPKYIIKRYSEPGDLVYDPMCGVGTTLIEAILEGRRAMGSDLNPISVLLSKVTSNPIDPAVLNPEINNLLCLITSCSEGAAPSLHSYISKVHSTNKPKIEALDLLGTEKYYSEGALSAIDIIHNCINSLEFSPIREFALVALLSILRRISNANNKKMNVVIDAKAKVYPPYQTFDKQINLMLKINRDFYQYKATNVEVFTAKADEIKLTDEHSDLIIIHPPYPTNTAFSEQLILQLALLGISHKTIWEDELAVRGSYAHKKNGVRYYLVNWFKTMKEIHRILKDSRYCGIVIGDGQIDYTRIPMGAITLEFAKDLGFKVVDYMTHRIHNTTGWTLNRRMKHDYIIILRK